MPCRYAPNQSLHNTVKQKNVLAAHGRLPKSFDELLDCFPLAIGIAVSNLVNVDQVRFKDRDMSSVLAAGGRVPFWSLICAARESLRFF